jgi:hypothetical protein
MYLMYIVIDTSVLAKSNMSPMEYVKSQVHPPSSFSILPHPQLASPCDTWQVGRPLHRNFLAPQHATCRMRREFRDLYESWPFFIEILAYGRYLFLYDGGFKGWSILVRALAIFLLKAADGSDFHMGENIWSECGDWVSCALCPWTCRCQRTYLAIWMPPLVVFVSCFRESLIV